MVFSRTGRTRTLAAALWSLGFFSLAGLSGTSYSRASESSLSPAQQSAVKPPPAGVSAADNDGDGIPDALEDQLAEQFAPVVVHDRTDPNLMCSVDWLLAHTDLYWYHDAGKFHTDDRVLAARHPSQAALLGFTHNVGETKMYNRSTRSWVTVKNRPVTSAGARSRGKKDTFLLYDVESPYRRGSMNTEDWKTYVHAYPNDLGGITLQYWRCYVYNTGAEDIKIVPGGIDNHGGDWECCQVVLDRNHRPVTARFPGHTSFEVVSWAQTEHEGDHIVVYSEPGGHATHAHYDGSLSMGPHKFFPNDLRRAENTIRQQTWNGGMVIWAPGSPAHSGTPVHLASGVGIPSGGFTATKSGGLINVGEKTRPLNGQVFIRYSGLWGDHSRGIAGQWSGYWGPAYNETAMGSDGFMTAWSLGMKALPGTALDVQKECYPDLDIE